MTHTIPPDEVTPVHIPAIDEIDTDQLFAEIEALQARRLRASTQIEEAVRKRDSKASQGTNVEKLNAKITKALAMLDKATAAQDKLEKLVQDLRIAQMELE